MTKETAEKEIAYRKELMQRIIGGGSKWTPEERFWALTHPLYNCVYSYPVLNQALETLAANQWYEITLMLESTTEKISDIEKCISIPAGKGKLLPKGEVIDNRGRPKVAKPVKMLSLTDYSVEQAESMKYYSDIGLLAVGYGCHYFDAKMNRNSGGYSANGTQILLCAVRHWQIISSAFPANTPSRKALTPWCSQ